MRLGAVTRRQRRDRTRRRATRNRECVNSYPSPERAEALDAGPTRVLHFDPKTGSFSCSHLRLSLSHVRLLLIIYCRHGQ